MIKNPVGRFPPFQGEGQGGDGGNYVAATAIRQASPEIANFGNFFPRKLHRGVERKQYQIARVFGSRNI